MPAVPLEGGGGSGMAMDPTSHALEERTHKVSTACPSWASHTAPFSVIREGHSMIASSSARSLGLEGLDLRPGGAGRDGAGGRRPV